MAETTENVQQKAQEISDMLETASEESEKVQSLLRMAWVCCMNMKDGRQYDFDPDKSDEYRNCEELQGIMTAIDECVRKLETVDEIIERAQKAAISHA